MKRYDTSEGIVFKHRDVWIEQIPNRRGMWEVFWNGDDVQREEVRTLAAAKMRARAIAKWPDYLKSATIPGGLWSEATIKEHYPEIWQRVYGAAAG